jgi:5-methylcytosine-specific restriction endonuclease McrA
VTAYKRRWGSVRRACELLAKVKRGEMSREEMLKGESRAARRKTVRLDVRWRVMRRDRFRCVACGRSPATEPGVELHVDHVVPVARGGGNEEGNLRTLCAACNVGRGVAAA